VFFVNDIMIGVGLVGCFDGIISQSKQPILELQRCAKIWDSQVNPPSREVINQSFFMITIYWSYF